MIIDLIFSGFSRNLIGCWNIGM